MSEISSQNFVPFKSAGIITLEWLKEYARVSGDPNQIHQDLAVARAMGLPNVIAHGMLISGILHSRALEAAQDYRELRGFRIGSSRTRFKAMTLLGDEVLTGGQWQVMGANEIKLDLEARNARGDVTVAGTFNLIR